MNIVITRQAERYKIASPGAVETVNLKKQTAAGSRVVAITAEKKKDAGSILYGLGKPTIKNTVDAGRLKRELRVKSYRVDPFHLPLAGAYPLWLEQPVIDQVVGFEGRVQFLTAGQIRVVEQIC